MNSLPVAFWEQIRLSELASRFRNHAPSSHGRHHYRKTQRLMECLFIRYGALTTTSANDSDNGSKTENDVATQMHGKGEMDDDVVATQVVFQLVGLASPVFATLLCSATKEGLEHRIEPHSLQCFLCSWGMSNTHQGIHILEQNVARSTTFWAKSSIF